MAGPEATPKSILGMRRPPSDGSLKMSTVKVTDDSFERDVLQSEGPVLVDFWAEWCGPCKQIAPALDQISEELADHLTVAKVDIEENPTTPSRYGVRGIPTMMLFRGGQM